MRVVICEDLVLLREGIASLLTDEGNEVVAAVGDGDALLDAVDEHRPDLSIIDVRLPPTQTDEGVRAAVEVRRRQPEVAILILSQYVEERYASDLLSGGSPTDYVDGMHTALLAGAALAAAGAIAGGLLIRKRTAHAPAAVALEAA